MRANSVRFSRYFSFRQKWMGGNSHERYYTSDPGAYDINCLLHDVSMGSTFCIQKMRDLRDL